MIKLGLLVFLDDGELLVRVKRVEILETLRWRSTKSGRSVMRQAQRMASAGSICDL